MEEVNKADREKLCRWYRFLPSAFSLRERTIQDRIYARWTEEGGFTPLFSKRIGWGSLK